jgi:uracil-DNA glycosylase
MATKKPSEPLKDKNVARGLPARVKDASPLVPKSGSLDVVAHAASDCKACPLWQDNEGTVFGEGPHDAQVMFVGEQPGDQEDKQGRPFVGPAGRILDECLKAAGLDRSHVYLTNTVKHFAHHRDAGGKRRLHDRPKPGDVRACRPWLDAELRHVQPKVLVALGATAAKALLGSKFSLMKERGQFKMTSHSLNTIATLHPSAILRAMSIDRKAADRMKQTLIDDLKQIKRKLDELSAEARPQ